MDIIISLSLKQFEEMQSVTENIKFVVWNCALIGVQKVFFSIFYIYGDVLIF